MSALAQAETNVTGWTVGFVIGVVVVLAVVALVTPILLLARRIGQQAAELNEPLQRAVSNTAALEQLNTTIDHAEVIVAGLARGRARLGG
ncbi:hypothetical protein [Thermocrispum municipale]|jgi:predicted Holliday junction resolvase-like endonuclease|uniref:hypothetical protein n=1 Tax=Thermocrispum municipale TaxID=37926 RepID=UPI00042671EA|nr:hypothetical protein [Thermocrispum municipale]